MNSNASFVSSSIYIYIWYLWSELTRPVSYLVLYIYGIYGQNSLVQFRIQFYIYMVSMVRTHSSSFVSSSIYIWYLWSELIRPVSYLVLYIYIYIWYLWSELIRPVSNLVLYIYIYMVSMVRTHSSSFVSSSIYIWYLWSEPIRPVSNLVLYIYGIYGQNPFVQFRIQFYIYIYIYGIYGQNPFVQFRIQFYIYMVSMVRTHSSSFVSSSIYIWYLWSEPIRPVSYLVLYIYMVSMVRTHSSSFESSSIYIWYLWSEPIRPVSNLVLYIYGIYGQNPFVQFRIQFYIYIYGIYGQNPFVQFRIQFYIYIYMVSMVRTHSSSFVSSSIYIWYRWSEPIRPVSYLVLYIYGIYGQNPFVQFRIQFYIYMVSMVRTHSSSFESSSIYIWYLWSEPIRPVSNLVLYIYGIYGQNPFVQFRIQFYIYMVSMVRTHSSSFESSSIYIWYLWSEPIRPVSYLVLYIYIYGIYGQNPFVQFRIQFYIYMVSMVRTHSSSFVSSSIYIWYLWSEPIRPVSYLVLYIYGIYGQNPFVQFRIQFYIYMVSMVRTHSSSFESSSIYIWYLWSEPIRPVSYLVLYIYMVYMVRTHSSSFESSSIYIWYLWSELIRPVSNLVLYIYGIYGQNPFVQFRIQFYIYMVSMVRTHSSSFESSFYIYMVSMVRTHSSSFVSSSIYIWYLWSEPIRPVSNLVLYIYGIYGQNSLVQFYHLTRKLNLETKYSCFNLKLNGTMEENGQSTLKTSTQCLCFPCRVHSPCSDSTFVNTGFKDALQSGKKRNDNEDVGKDKPAKLKGFAKHENSRFHTNAVNIWKEREKRDSS